MNRTSTQPIKCNPDLPKKPIFLREYCPINPTPKLIDNGKTSWLIIEALKGLTSEIDFKCNFDKNGSGCGRPHYNSERCCCEDCAESQLDYVVTDKDVLGYITTLYDKNMGFWRKGVGCILERKYRPNVCLGYRCAPRLSKREYLIEYIGGKNIIEGVKLIVWYKNYKNSNIFDLSPSISTVQAFIEEAVKFLLEENRKRKFIKLASFDGFEDEGQISKRYVLEIDYSLLDKTNKI